MRKSYLATICLTLLGCLLQPFAAVAEIKPDVNLLINGSATDPISVGWTNIVNGWGVTSGGIDGIGGQFQSAYNWCTRKQEIDLLAKGFTAAELDQGRPIYAREYFRSTSDNNGGGDKYFLKVQLLNASRGVVASWNVGAPTTADGKPAPIVNRWYLESHEFSNYGPGVRYITFEDGGIDGGFWAGFYGINMDGATVAFSNIPPTDITLSPGKFAANAVAGGVAGLLVAPDVDNLTHTFSFAPEIQTTPQNLIAASSFNWKYLDGFQVAAPNWADRDADETGWGAGQAPLGYDSTNAETWKNTQVSYGGNASAKPITAYFRKTFTVNDPSLVGGLSGTLMVDDGCVIYLNGHEVYRDNMPAGAVTSSTLAISGIGNADESDYQPFVIPADKLVHLVQGTNVIAVEVHQNAASSSDMSIDLTLDAAIITSINNFDNASFTIVDDQLRLAQSAASLGTGSRTIRVKAEDNGGNSIIKTLTVTGLSQTFTATPTALTLTTVNALEEQPIARVLADFSASDADVGDLLRYEFVSGAGDTDNAKFVIHQNHLYALAPLDFEVKSTYNIRVRVVDSVGLSATAALTYTITDDVTEDKDGDGLPESAEDVNNNGIVDPGETDPLLADTDGDGYNDKLERDNGSDPTLASSVPTAIPLRQIVAHGTDQSWLTASSWQGGVLPTFINIALVDNLQFRPPPTANPVFPGIGVDLRNNAVFRLKHTGLASIGKIKLDNATIQHGMTVAIALGGGGSTLETNTIGTIDTAGYPLDMQAALSGKGVIRVLSSTAAPGLVTFPSPALNFTGDLVVAGAEVQISTTASMGNVGRLISKAGKLKFTAPVSLPNAILVQSGIGVIGLAGHVSVASAIMSDIVIPAGTFTATDLMGLGVPPNVIEDGGGTLTVSGLLNTADSDGDGASDLEEALALTDARNANSKLKFSTLASDTSLGTSGVLLRWASVPGVTYRLEFADSLPAQWQTVTTVTATGSVTEYVDILYPGFFPDKGFYHLIVVP